MMADGSKAPMASSQWQQQDTSVAKVMWVFGDISCVHEAELPVEPFNGGEVNIRNGPGNGHLYLQLPLNSSF